MKVLQKILSRMAGSSPVVEEYFWLFEAVCIVAVVVALGFLGVRAGVRLEPRWDNLAYHLPYAMIRGGIDIPFKLGDVYTPMFQGFPPLSALLQGMLWRITGNIHATGVINYIAFIGFLAYCHFLLKARFWLVGMIALTAPLVIIHTATGYDDLLGNTLLATGFGALLRFWLFPQTAHARGVLFCGLLGVIGAVWTKFMMVPMSGVVFVSLWALCYQQHTAFGWSRRRLAIVFLIAGLIAAAPYIKNIIYYHNPFWPYQLPIFSDYVPYAIAPSADTQLNRPRTMVGQGQFLVYINSLFEIHHPTHYDFRPRWVIDQGTAYVAFRAGGFWNVGVSVYVGTAILLLLTCSRQVGRRRAIGAALALFAVIAFVGLLPQSNELRYFLFMPLLWALAIGMMYPQLRHDAPLIAAAFLSISFGMFLYMVWANSEHYVPENLDYLSIAKSAGVDKVWDAMEKGQSYCAIDVDPLGLFLTGPTMTEFNVTAVSRVDMCPDGSTGIAKADILDIISPGIFRQAPRR